MRKIRNTFSLFSALLLCVICISSLSLTSHAYTFDSLSTTYTATQSHQHTWMPVGFIPRTHPHTTKVSCQCGDTRYNCVLLTGVPADCNLCKSNTKTASSSTKKSGVLVYIDGDQGLGLPITVPVVLVTQYTNKYNYPNVDVPGEGIWPAFSSFYSFVSASVENVPFHAPDVVCSASSKPVIYYYSNGTQFRSQEVILNGQGQAYAPIGVASIYDKPSYTIVHAACGISGGFGSFEGSTKTYFK